MQLFIIRACSSHPAPDGAQLLQTMATPACAVGTPQSASRPSPALLLSECFLATKGLNPSVFLQPIHSCKELQAYLIQAGLSSWSICVIAASEQQRQRGDLVLHLVAKRHHKLRNVHVHCHTAMLRAPCRQGAAMGILAFWVAGKENKCHLHLFFFQLLLQNNRSLAPTKVSVSKSQWRSYWKGNGEMFTTPVPRQLRR